MRIDQPTDYSQSITQREAIELKTFKLDKFHKQTHSVKLPSYSQCL